VRSNLSVFHNYVWAILQYFETINDSTWHIIFFLKKCSIRNSKQVSIVLEMRLIYFTDNCWLTTTSDQAVNNNTTYASVYSAVTMARPIHELVCLFDEYRLSAKRLPTLRLSHLTWAVSLPVVCHHLHPLSPFTITQPEGRCSFCSPTEGRRLSWPRWLSTYWDGLPSYRRSPIQVLTRPNVEQLRCSRPTCYR